MFTRRCALLAMPAVALAACSRAGGPGAEMPSSELRLSILSATAPSILAADWAPILADLKAAYGLDTIPTYFDAGPAIVESLRRGRTDVGLFDNAAVLEAVRKAGGDVFARCVPLSGPDHSILLASGRRGAPSLHRVLRCDRTLRIGLGELASIPDSLALETYLLAPISQAPSNCFRTVRRATQSENLADLAAGRLDIVVAGEAQWAEQRSRSDLGAAAPRVIWRSPDLPARPLVWRRELDPAIREKVRQFFLTYGQDAAQRSRLARIGLAGFAPADDSHLAPMREMAAAQAWLEALRGGDRGHIALAREAYESAAADREALEARTGVPAGLQ